MVSEKSRANLAKGRVKGIKRRATNNKVPQSKTWAALIVEYGETVSDIDPTKTWKQLVVSAAYRQAALGNAPILRELMQRSEPQGAEATGEMILRVVYGNRTDNTSAATPSAPA